MAGPREGRGVFQSPRTKAEFAGFCSGSPSTCHPSCSHRAIPRGGVWSMGGLNCDLGVCVKGSSYLNRENLL